MSKKSLGIGSSRSVAADVLDAQLTGFLAVLRTMGYTPTTQHSKRWLVRRFVRWVRRAGLAVGDLDEACVGRFLESRRSRPRKMERATLRQFIEHLRAMGVAPPRSASEPSSAEVLLRRYGEHLRSDRGLCVRSVEVYAPFASAFIEAHGLPERVVSLDARAVRDHLVDRSRDRTGSFVKLLAAALRSFLRFLFFDGMT